MLELVRDRLLARLTDPRWAGIAIAEDIDVLTELAGQVETGTAIVMPWRERAAPTMDAAGAFRQLVTEQIAVGIVLRLHDAGMGGDRVVRFAAYRNDLEQALAGWVPPGSPGNCSLLGGESSPVTKGVSIYVQTWEIPRFLTGEFS